MPEPIKPLYNALPATGFIRESTLTTRQKSGQIGILPFSPATLWRKVRTGQFPQPVKLGERITAWRVEEVQAWIAAQAAGHSVQAETVVKKGQKAPRQTGDERGL